MRGEGEKESNPLFLVAASYVTLSDFFFFLPELELVTASSLFV